MAVWFKLTRPAEASVHMQSRDGCIYLYRAMQFIGWLPPQRLRGLYKLWTLLTFTFSTFYLPLAFLISYNLHMNNFTPGDFLTSLQVALNAFGSSFKALIAYTQLWRLLEACNVLDQMDKRCRHNDEEFRIINVAVARANLLFLIYTFVYCGYVASTFFSAVLSGHPPWQLYNPFVDWQLDVAHLWLASLIEYVVMAGAVLQDQLADTYGLVFVLILRAHLSILKTRIRNLRTDSRLSVDAHYEQLVHCIIDHKLIIHFCNLIRPLISGTIFVQFLLIGIVLGLTLINLFFFADIWSGLASFVFLVAVLLQTFPFCYLCNMLIEDCDALTNAIFQSNWFDAELRYKRTLLYFLHGAQQPIIFTAMGIFPISVSSNITVAKFAFSVLTIAKQMNFVERFKT